MHLIKREINDFPIGTKIHTRNGGEFLKIKGNAWQERYQHDTRTDEYMFNIIDLFDFVEIPNYIKYDHKYGLLDLANEKVGTIATLKEGAKIIVVGENTLQCVGNDKIPDFTVDDILKVETPVSYETVYEQ